MCKGERMSVRVRGGLPIEDGGRAFLVGGRVR